MTALIDLEAYAEEVASFCALAETFVARESAPALNRIVDDLRAGIAKALPKWTWSTPKPIHFQPSSQYDSPGKKPRSAHFTLGFECSFNRPQKVNKKPGAVWAVAHTATHIKVERDDNALHCLHFDYKNANQLGPQLHIQVSEANTGGLPIPRLASAAFLPTDCADVMLCELHPDAWEKRQRAGNNQWHVGVVRDGQEHRTVAYLNDIASQWRADIKRTRFSLIQAYTSTVPSLPSHKNKLAQKGW